MVKNTKVLFENKLYDLNDAQSVEDMVNAGANAHSDFFCAYCKSKVFVPLENRFNADSCSLIIYKHDYKNLSDIVSTCPYYNKSNFINLFKISEKNFNEGRRDLFYSNIEYLKDNWKELLDQFYLYVFYKLGEKPKETLSLFKKAINIMIETNFLFSDRKKIDMPRYILFLLEKIDLNNDTQYEFIGFQNTKTRDNPYGKPLICKDSNTGKLRNLWRKKYLSKYNSFSLLLDDDVIQSIDAMISSII